MKKISVKHYLNTRLKPEIEGKEKIYPLYLSVTYDRMNIRIPSNIINGISTSITEKKFIEKKIDKKTLFKLNYEIDLIKRCVEIFKDDEDKKQLNKNLQNFYSLKKYRSKTERLNIFNSYIDYYTHSIYDVVADTLKSRIETKLLQKIKSEINNLELQNVVTIDLLFSPNNSKLYELINKYGLDYNYKMYYILWSRFQSFLAYEGLNYSYDMPYIDWVQNKGQTVFLKFLKDYERSTDNWDIDLSDKDNATFCINIIEEIITKDDYFDLAKH